MRYLNFKKEIILLPVFLTLYIVYYWFPITDLALKSISQFSGDIATFEGVDVSNRILLFYKTIAFSIIIFLVLNFIFNWISERFSYIKVLIKISSSLALWGILLMLLLLMKVTVLSSVNLFFGTLISLLITGLIRKNQVIEKPLLIKYFIVQAIITFIISSIFNYISFILINKSLLTFEWTFCALFFIVQIVCTVFEKKFIVNIEKFTTVFRPLAIVPLLPFFCTEIYLILNQHNIHFLSPFIFYLILFGLVILAIFIRRNTRADFEKNITGFWFPVLLTGIVVSINYQPIIQQSKDLFELANGANGLMRMFQFCEVPFIHFFNSHLISDYFFGTIYVLLNGYHNSTDFLIYNFSHNLIFVLASYYILRKIFSDGYFAFIFVVFFPFLQTMMWQNNTISILSVFVVYRLFESYSFKNLIVVFLFGLFLMFWKADLAVTNTISMIVIFMIFLILHFNKSIFKDLIKLISIFLIIGIACIIILITLNIPIISNAKQALSYLGANQQHGLPVITHTLDRLFFWHYFIFPGIVISLSLYLIYRFKSLFEQTNQRFNILLLIFLIVYYLINAQRGLVRHSMAEGQSMFMSSFIFLILILAFIVYFNKNDWLKKGVLIFSVILLQSFIYPDIIDSENLCTSFQKKENQIKIIKNEPQKIKRVTELFANENYINLKKFMDYNFSVNSTFIDFSNSPMLYFYTGRKVPSYFNQYMQNLVSDYLQKKNLEQLSKFDIPVVIFSNEPQTWFDCTDGVANTIRYQHIANYIFANYEPFGVIDKHYIWLKKDLNLSYSPKVEKPLEKVKEFDLKNYPLFLGQSTLFAPSKILLINPLENFNDSNLLKNNNFIELTIKCNSAKSQYANISYLQNDSILGSFKFIIKPSEKPEKYIIPLSSQYNWWINNVNGFKLTIPPESNAKLQLSRLISL